MMVGINARLPLTPEETNVRKYTIALEHGYDVELSKDCLVLTFTEIAYPPCHRVINISEMSIAEFLRFIGY